MGKVTNWVSEFTAWLEVRKICGTVEYRCKLCAERGTTLICKGWRVCIGNTKEIQRTHHVQAHRNCRSGTLVRRKEVV